MSCSIALAQDLQSAIKLTRSEQFRKADIKYRLILKKHPTDGNVYYYFGENYLQKYFSDTLTYQFNEIADSAGKLFKEGLKIDPDNPLNNVGLGEIELIYKRINEAQIYFDKAFSLLPSKSNKKSTISKKDNAVVLIKMAEAYLKAHINDSEKINNLLDKAEKLDNKNFDLYIVKGDAALQLENNGSVAIKFYTKAQNLNPESPRAKLRLGQLWFRTKSYTSALEYYKEAINIDSNFAPAYREMGYLFLLSNKPTKAKECYEKFLKLSAGSRNARIQYINTLLDLPDYKEAIIQINIIMKQDSSNNDFNRALGYAYYETGEYDKGLYYITKFINNVQPEKIRTLDFVYYGKLLAKNNMDSLSGEVLMKAYEMDTTQIDLLNQVITAYLKMKEYNKAAELVLKKTMLKKNVAYDYYVLGKIYYNLHEWQKADSAFSINISLNPSYIKGYLWKAYSLVNLDSNSKNGLAKPAFEMLIENARTDTAKYSSELKVAYSYLAYYYLLQYFKTNKQEFGITSKEYSLKVLAIDPSDRKAKAILNDLNARMK
jgi:tetratricopeptide (TPR) repeat protein